MTYCNGCKEQFTVTVGTVFERHTNTIEGYFSILKRGINGTYYHVSQKHLKRCLAEFDFLYNNRSKLGIEDSERAMRAMVGIEGKVAAG